MMGYKIILVVTCITNRLYDGVQNHTRRDLHNKSTIDGVQNHTRRDLHNKSTT